MRLLLTTFFMVCAWAGLSHAQCSGEDLRATMLPEEIQELDRRLNDTPFATGNHWRATRGADVIHLIGTVHLSDDRLDGPLERLSPVIANADRLLLEMTKDEMAELELAMGSRPDLLLMPDTTLPELLSEEDWTLLKTAFQERGTPAFMGAKMQPWVVSMMLSIPTCMAAAISNPNGLDDRLQAIADAEGVPTQSLEGYDTAFRKFGEVPMDLQLAMVRASLVDGEIGEDLFETLMAAYFAQNHAEVMIVTDILSPRLSSLTPEENAAMYAVISEQLLESRNKAWIPVILSALNETDGVVVAAFGAAHLAGDTGVLQLLQDEGFALERLPF